MIASGGAVARDGGPRRTRVRATRWLCDDTFELELERPEDFEFVPGQHIRLLTPLGPRDYSLTNGPDDPTLTLCVRRMPGESASAHLAGLPPGDAIEFLGPRGHFVRRPSAAREVWVAAGTGVAPFVSMARWGQLCAVMLQGARAAEHLHYASLMRAAAARYVACLSQPGEAAEPVFLGRVTEYLDAGMEEGRYDFYLCGSGEMIHEALAVIDRRFPHSRVFAEAFD